MSNPDLTKLVVYCPNVKCSDSVQSPDGTMHYQRRQMVFHGFNFLGQAVYRCPVDGKTRRFKENALSDGIHEV